MPQMSFFRALAWALAIHLVFLGVFVFTWKGSSKDYRVDFFFWGGILRQQELMPMQVEEGPGERSLRLISPSSILAPVQMGAWRLGSSVEKPESVRIRVEDKGIPTKFMTERVELNEPDRTTSENARLGIPEAPRVYLRQREP